MMYYNWAVFDEKTRRGMVARNCKRGYFDRIVGQNGAVDVLAGLIYQGLGVPDHCVPVNLMFVGPPSVGKTLLVTTLADALCVTCVHTEANQLKNNTTLARLILEEWAKHTPIKPDKVYGSTELYHLDSTIVFIDEIHGLSRIVQDGLLKATERNDGMLLTKNLVLDLRKTLWIGATTDWGKLCPAFQSRFMRCQLYPYNADEVTEIVRRYERGDMPLTACKRIVHFAGLIPREAIAFAEFAKMEAACKGISLEAAIEAVAKREGIDQYGMHAQRIQLLRILNGAKKDGCILRQLIGGLGLQQDEIIKHWLPPMLNSGLVIFDGGQYHITDKGKAELQKRGY